MHKDTDSINVNNTLKDKDENEQSVQYGISR